MSMTIPPLPPISSTPAMQGGAGAVKETAATAPAPRSDLVEQFRAKIEQARLSPQSVTHFQGPSAVSQMITQQDQAMGTLTNKVDAFAAGADKMSMQEVVAQSVKVQLDVATLTAKLYLGQTLAQGSKGAIQTLVKNQ
jgi:type III secretion inner rod protein HrpB2